MDHPPLNMHIDAARGSASGQSLTVFFTGRVLGAANACGADYTAEAVESAAGVAVIIHEHPNPYAGVDANGIVCTMVGAVRTAVVALSRPLAERAVLETNRGQPVPVARLP